MVTKSGQGKYGLNPSRRTTGQPDRPHDRRDRQTAPTGPRAGPCATTRALARRCAPRARGSPHGRAATRPSSGGSGRRASAPPASRSSGTPARPGRAGRRRTPRRAPGGPPRGRRRRRASGQRGIARIAAEGGPHLVGVGHPRLVSTSGILAGRPTEVGEPVVARPVTARITPCPTRHGRADHRSRPHGSLRRLLRGVPRPPGRRRRLPARAGRPDHRDVPGEGDPRRRRLPDRQGPRPGRGAGGAGVDGPPEVLPRPDRADPATTTATPVTIGLDDGTEITAGAVIITAGIGKFSPRPLPAGDGWLGRGMEFFVPSFQPYAGKDVVIVGGGDSAFDWAQHLEPVAPVDHPRAPPRRVPRPPAHRRRRCVTARSRSSPGRRSPRCAARGRSRRSRSRVDGEEPVVTPGAGGGRRPRLHRRPRAAPGVGDRGREAARRRRRPRCRRSLPRVFAAGDITEYPGKVRLIAVGFGEAATAVNNAAVAIDPSAHVFPGHSSEGT